jgi:transcriptional regulator with XRE-family HTH domain
MVGEKIRKLRLDRNMTLAELGSELGISHQQLQKYETRHQSPERRHAVERR